MFVAGHLFLTALAAAVLAWQFGHAPATVASHLLLVAEWDLAILATVRALRLGRASTVVLFASTFTAQAFLYALDAIGNASWGRNVTLRLVRAFASTVWSGKEPFPVAAPGITVFLTVTFATMTAISIRWGRTGKPAAGSRGRAVLAGCAAAAAFAATLSWGVADRDRLLWKDEPLAGFFRPVGYAFEPTARREAMAARDAALRASYQHPAAGARRANVVLIIIDSLRADRMQAYGYPRETTPFLAQLVRAGRMKRVEAAFSTCSESFCGITSTLASREFLDISARTYELQDVLRDEGYRTWFLLSGNHTAWNGLTSFYRADEGMLVDASHSQRYTMDDDRVVLEGLDRVPHAAPDRPAFFYVHLMSTHYLGVQLPESHVFTRPDDVVGAGADPYSILPQLEKPDRYDDKVRQADGMVRQIFEALEAKGYLEDAVVVIAGDHGEGLGERHWAHGWHLYNEDLRIPLLLYDAPAAAYPDLSFAAQVDIAPTILDRLGLPIPASWAGESLLAPSKKRFTYHQTYFIPNRYAVLYRNGDALFKFIATPQYGKEELYDLTRDARETHNLVGERPDLAALLRARLREYRENER